MIKPTLISRTCVLINNDPILNFDPNPSSEEIMTKHRIILNPTAGRGTAQKAILEIEKLLNQLGVDFDVVSTTQQGDGVALAQQAVKDGIEVIVSAGGDGTANEVINGLMTLDPAERQNVAMAVLPIGTGNDYAFGIHIPIDTEQACQLLADGNRKTIDIGRVFGGDFPEGRYFGNCIGIGFDAEAGFVAAKLSPLRGLLSYLIAALLTNFIYFKAATLEVKYDGGEFTKPILMCSIMNGTRLGGGFHMTPDAKTDDGMFDMCIADDVSRMRVFGLIPLFMKGTQASEPEIHVLQGSSITVTSKNGTFAAHVDGETLCEKGTEVKVELHPKALNIITL
jgi:YegS/Rv2252/BmrU family lipid kinase